MAPSLLAPFSAPAGVSSVPSFEASAARALEALPAVNAMPSAMHARVREEKSLMIVSPSAEPKTFIEPTACATGASRAPIAACAHRARCAAAVLHPAPCDCGTMPGRCRLAPPERAREGNLLCSPVVIPDRQTAARDAFRVLLQIKKIRTTGRCAVVHSGLH